MHEFMHLSFLTATPSPALYYMVVTLLVLGAVSLQAPNTIPNVTVHPNASFGGAIWSSHETNWYIKYLANVTSFEACLEACRAWDAQPGAKCKAAQWYYPNSTEPRSQGCYARIDGLNQTTPQQDVISAQLAWPCVTDEDCNLNGVCGANGTCACDPQWDGADCGALRLLPAPKDGGTATWFATRNGSSQWVSGGPVPKQLRPLRSPPPAVAWALSSQGGNPFRSFDGRYHVFVVEMTKSCAIVDYTTNSRIVQASSSSPLGPSSSTPCGERRLPTRHVRGQGPMVRCWWRTWGGRPCPTRRSETAAARGDRGPRPGAGRWRTWKRRLGRDRTSRTATRSASGSWLRRARAVI